MTVLVHTQAGKKSGRQLWVADGPQTCKICSLTIRKGERFARGITKEPYHPICRLWRSAAVKGMAKEPRNFTSPIQIDRTKICASCSEVIQKGERVAHVQGEPWHHSCRVQFR